MRGSQAATSGGNGPNQIQIEIVGMNAEQIAEALRFVAMGRPNHPRVVELAEYLAAKEQAKEADKPKRKKAE